MWTVMIQSEIRVVGQNPEMADLDNPRGDLHSEVFFLVAEDSYGYRFAFDGEIPENVVQRLVMIANFEDYINQGSINPYISHEWSAIRPAYGSDAYLYNQQECYDDYKEQEENW